VIDESLETVGETLMLTGPLIYLHGRRILTEIAAAAEPQARDTAGSNSVRGASPQSRSRS